MSTASAAATTASTETGSSRKRGFPLAYSNVAGSSVAAVIEEFHADFRNSNASCTASDLRLTEHRNEVLERRCGTAHSSRARQRTYHGIGRPPLATRHTRVVHAQHRRLVRPPGRDAPVRLPRPWNTSITRSRMHIVETPIPTTLDSTLAPAGAHVASSFCRSFSYNTPGGRDWRQEKQSAIDRVFATADSYAANFSASDVGQSAFSTLDH